MHKENSEIIQALLNCAQECDHCASACLKEDDVKMMARCISLDMDCAEICYTTARLLTRGSEVSSQVVKACTEICRMCADECGKHKHMDHCQSCAEACRRCEEACKSYA